MSSPQNAKKLYGGRFLLSESTNLQDACCSVKSILPSTGRNLYLRAYQISPPSLTNHTGVISACLNDPSGFREYIILE